MNTAIREVQKALDAYKFNEACHHVYQFIWHELCDWYLELVKPYLYQDRGCEEEGDHSGDPCEGLRCHAETASPLHALHHRGDLAEPSRGERAESIMVAAFPQPDERFDNEDVADEMELVIEVITAIRNIRGEMNIPPGDQICLHASDKR